MYGIPGCGKTILSATIIETLLEIRERTSNCALAYFYFAFDDAGSQRVEPMIRSLAAQLCSQSMSIHPFIDTLYKKCSRGLVLPTLNDLQDALAKLLDTFDQVYIVLDALDECTEQQQMTIMIKQIARWNKPQLHLLATSRKEWGIEEIMIDLVKEANRTCIEGKSVDDDIESYIHNRLRTDGRLKRWRKLEKEQEIRETLILKANGMYVANKLLVHD